MAVKADRFADLHQAIEALVAASSAAEVNEARVMFYRSRWTNSAASIFDGAALGRLDELTD